MLKKHWIDRALDTEKAHIYYCKEYPGAWTIWKTAELLGRSEGSVNQDIIIASWMKTHESELRKLSGVVDAMIFIRDRKKNQKLTSFED